MFALDLRSLALMRVAVGAVVLIDVLVRMAHLSAHYSDQGVLSRADAAALDPLARVSLLALHGSPEWAGLVFVLAVGCSLAVIAGWRTRLVTALLWLCVVSIQHRNPWLGDHRDALINCMLVWGMLLPWGRVLSVDARRDGGISTRYVGVAGVGYVLQIGCLYLFAAILKSGPEWRSEYTAVYYALSVDYWTLPPARALLAHPWLTRALTVSTVWFEAAVAALLLIPWRVAGFRTVVVTGVIGMQIGFGVCIWLGTFPLISSAAMLGLLPATFWTLPGVRRIARWGIARSQDAGAPEAAEPVGDGRVPGVVAALVTGSLLLLNVLSASPGVKPDAHPVLSAAALLGFSQNWDMFAPSPSRIDGSFVAEGRSASGDIVDLSPRFRTTRELVYFRRLLRADKRALQGYATYQCRSSKLSSPLASVTLHFLREYIPPPGVPAPAVEKQVVIEHACPYASEQVPGARER